MTVNKKKIRTLNLLCAAKRNLTLSESYEQIKAIDDLIIETNKATDLDKLMNILMDGLKTQQEGQRQWEQRMEETI